MITNIDNQEQNGLLEDERYTLNRLVYINSAHHAYSEIMLDKHMALFGQNNAGKTACLAGTKLVLFPETDFYNCEDKFKFKGKTGLYSMEHSYEFYFPDHRSFIVLEVCNPEGTFCMILFKKGKYGYNRIMIPVPYEDLRPVFWDKEANLFSSDIGVPAVTDFMKARDGILVTDRKEIAELMFSSHLESKARKRFCVLPFKSAKKESIDAFRNIYHMAFDSGDIETKTLPAAIATLIEMGRSRDQERVDADLMKLTHEHAALLKQSEWLQCLSNAAPAFEVIIRGYDDLKKQYQTYCETYYSIFTGCAEAKKEYTEKHNTLSELHQAAFKQSTKAAIDIKADSKQLDRQDGAVLEQAKVLKAKTKKLEKDKALRSTYADKPISEVMQWLEDDHKKQKTDLDNLKKEDGTQKVLANNIRKKNSLKSDIDKLTGLIESSELTLFHQLNDRDAASILYSINPALADITGELDVQSQKTILRFTKLFSQDGSGHLTFMNKTVTDISLSKFDLDQQQQEWVKTKEQKTLELDNVNSDISDQNDAINNKNIDQLIISAGRELQTTKECLTAIGGLNELTEEVARLTKEHAITLAEQETATIQLKEKKKAYGILNGQTTTYFNELTTVEQKKEGFDSIERSLMHAKTSIEPIFIKVEPLAFEQLTKEMAEKVIEVSRSCGQRFTVIKELVNQLIIDLPHPNVEEHRNYTNMSQYEGIISVYQSEFTLLDSQKTQHSDAVRSHNQVVSNQLNELKEASALIENFVSGINQEINSKRISNLSEIKLNAELNPSFISILKTLSAYNFNDDSLLETRFYESLGSFVQKHFNKQTRRLKMVDIISSVTYQYRVGLTGDLETKSQSGGTSSTVTAFILAVLLKRITPNYVNLQMPIIVDEIGTLDDKNTHATIKQISEQGFSIFCATPKFSASVGREVGQWIMIDQAMIKQPIVGECHINILPEQVESFGEHQNET